jgi:hypothetical protein
LSRDGIKSCVNFIYPATCVDWIKYVEYLLKHIEIFFMLFNAWHRNIILAETMYSQLIVHIFKGKSKLVNSSFISNTIAWFYKYSFIEIYGSRTKAPGHKPPILNCTSYLYICTHFGLVVLLVIYWLKLFLNTIFHNKLLLELEDITNNWNICLRIIITLIKESKNKIIKLFFL